MIRSLRHAILIVAVLAFPVLSGGCDKGKTDAPPPGGPPAPGGMGAMSPTHSIMVRLGKGPQSLTSVLGKDLNADPPPWDNVQSNAREYAKLAADLGKAPPSRGSKESWDKHTAAFAEAARGLDAAAQAKERDLARQGHKMLNDMCMGCHREHRMMRPSGRPAG
jgi:hypothetical protein